MDFTTKLNDALSAYQLNFIIGQYDSFAKRSQRFKDPRKPNKGKPYFLRFHKNGATFGDWRQDKSAWTTIYFDKEFVNTSTKKYRKKLISTPHITIINDKLKTFYSLLPTYMEKDATFNHPYIEKKRVVPYYAYQYKNCLSLPIHKIDGQIISLQLIYPNGFKRFMEDLSPKDGFVYLGEKITDNDIIWICEGYATGCSIYEAVGPHVICALSAHNLVSVAKQFRKAYPKQKIIICADNDANKEINTGVLEATKAAQESKSSLVIPSIAGDFNDLLCALGIEALQEELLQSTTTKELQYE
jgi:hypothetical protein